MKINHVLITTDFSAASDAASRYGIALARAFHATLDVLHVVEHEFVGPHVKHSDEVDVLRKRLEHRFGNAGTERRTQIVVGRSHTPADFIVGHSRSSGIDLIVMGTHGRSGLARVLMGSVAERVVRSAACPVLTVKRQGVAWQPESNGANAIALKNIMVATDFGAAADAALVYGRELSARFGATLHLVHVTEQVRPRWTGADLFAMEHDTEAMAHFQLDQRLIDNRGTGPMTRATVFTSASPVPALVEYAGDYEIDLMVTGTHGRGPLTHLVMGSVAERLVRLAPCPVLTVRHPLSAFVREDTLEALASV